MKERRRRYLPVAFNDKATKANNFEKTYYLKDIMSIREL